MKSESRYNRQKQAGYQSLLRLQGLTEEMADRLYDAGVTSLEEFVEASLTELEDVIHVSESTLAAMVEEAGQLLARDEAAAAREAESAAEAPLDQGEFPDQLNPEDETPEKQLSGDEIGA